MLILFLLAAACFFLIKLLLPLFLLAFVFFIHALRDYKRIPRTPAQKKAYWSIRPVPLPYPCPPVDYVKYPHLKYNPGRHVNGILDGILGRRCR